MFVATGGRKGCCVYSSIAEGAGRGAVSGLWLEGRVCVGGVVYTKEVVEERYLGWAVGLRVRVPVVELRKVAD